MPDVTFATSPPGQQPPDPPRRRVRLAAGRARALGLPTRGTTAPNRLRRVDRWLAAELTPTLTSAPDPLLVDLGFGASPVTTVETFRRLQGLVPGLRVVGLEIDAERVTAAASAADPPSLTFAVGGFELAGLAPQVVRAMNVLRQYDERAVRSAWDRMCANGALVVEGTCDEIGRRACWFLLQDGRPRSLTLSAHLASLQQPSELAERLPKALIARNVPGEPVHALLSDLDAAWATAAGSGVFGPRQRWLATVEALRAAGRWDVRGNRRRWRLGEVTVAWPPDS